MRLIINLQESWDGHSGEEVLGFITEQIMNLIRKDDELKGNVDLSIKDIKFSVNKNKVTCQVKRDSEWVDGPVFELSAASDSKPTLTISDWAKLSTDNTILQYGNSFLFSCSWCLQDVDGKIYYLGATAKLVAEITNENGLSHKYEVGTLSPTIRGGETAKLTFVIPAKEFTEGTCTIEFDIDGTYTGKTLILPERPNFKINILNPILDVRFDEENGIDKFRELNDKFNIYLDVKNSKGKQLTVNGKSIKIKKLFYYGTVATVSTEENSVNWSINDIKNTVVTTLSGRLRIFILAEISVGDVIVRSNIVMLYLMANTDVNQDYIWFATQLNSVKEIYTGNPTIYVNLYDNTNFKIFAYSKNEAKLDYKIILNGIPKNLTSIDLLANKVTDISYSYIFRNDNDNHIFRISSNDQEININVNVQSIGSTMDELNSLIISLSSLGKRLGDTEWVSNGYSVEFDSNFNWSGNGWINNALLVNSGATAIIEYCPFSTNQFMASFKFDASNSILDEKLIYCESGDTGFAIYPEKAEFKINGIGISTEFDSTSPHEISFVRYGSSYGNIISIYVDGTILQSKVAVGNTANMNSNIFITSQFTLLYLYNINIFDKALSFTNVQSVNCFNKRDSLSIIDYVKDNNVFTKGTSTDVIGTENGLIITPDTLPMGSRYMIISEYNNSGNKANPCLDKAPWKTIDEYPGAEADKYKGIYHLVGNVLLAEKTQDGIHPRNFIVDKATIAAQGTSSMAYPLKNFRIAFGKPINSTCPYYNLAGGSKNPKAGDFGYSTMIITGVPENAVITTSGTTFGDYNATYVGKLEISTKCKYPIRSKKFGDDIDSADAKIFCLKADYAESSGSHNTGFARLVHDALTNSSNICPNRESSHLLPQLTIVNSVVNKKYKKEIRSTIDGYPIYLFFKDTDGNIIYHGKYNFNNEKSSKDVFGFEKIHDYFNNDIVKNESNVLKRLFNDTLGYYDATHFKYGIIDGEFEDDDTKVSLNYINPTECWEFSNNTFTVEPTAQNVIGAFQYPYTDEQSHDGFPYPNSNNYPNRNPFTVKDEDGELAWITLAWEYRYPGLDEGSTGDLYYRNGTCKPYILNSLYKWLYKHNGTLINFDKNTINDFAENLHKYFNVNYLLKYFVLTKWFGNVDQRIKNCMLSFYCDPTVLSNEDIDSPMGHMRAYYIFYDNDTIMGVDNAGTLTLEWDIDESAYPGYQKHAIWDNLEFCYNEYVKGTDYEGIRLLGELIEAAYQSIRKVITDDKLKKYFDEEQTDKFPDAIHNLDAEIKYYYAGELNSTTSNFNSTNIAKLQGNRKYHRKRWLTKRTNWMDAKFKAGNIDSYSYQFKVGGTSGISLPGGEIELTTAINNWRFHITNSTSGLKISSKLLNFNDTTNSDKRRRTNTAFLRIPENSFSISDFILIEALYGCESINFNNFKTSTYFLDLSNGGNTLPYMKYFTLNEKDNTEKKKFSSAALEKLLTISSEGGSSYPLFPNLEELNICNTEIADGDNSTRFKAIDLSLFSKLTKIDATGTDIDIILPNSGNLTNLTLQSPQNLNITNKPNITNLNIIDDSSIKYIELGINNNSYIYSNVLDLIINKISVNGFSAKVEIGTKTNYYHISNQELNKLVLLAEGNYNNITVSGYLLNPDVTPETVELLTTKFKNLTISLKNTTSLEFRLSSPLLEEGKLIIVSLTSGILESETDWYWEVYDDVLKKFIRNNSVLQLISENTTKTKLTLKAPISGNNDSKTYRLRVGGFYSNRETPDMYGGDTPIEILVQYIKVDKITILANKYILRKNLSTDITYTCSPEKQTKSQWINDNISWICTGGSLSSSLLFQKGDNEEDATIKATISDINTNTITIMYDRELCKYDDVKVDSNTNDKKWIYNILFDKYGTLAQNYNSITISVLNNILISNSQLSLLLSYSYEDYVVPLDLEYMQYCKFSDSKFTIPSSLKFTNINIPNSKGLTSVEWSPNIDDYFGYGKIVFNEYMETAIINIVSTSSKLSNLILDFSKTKIKKIYNGGGSCSNMSASVSFTYDKSLLAGAPSGSPIFIYPSTILTLGNYVDIADWSTNTLPVIFNISDSNTSTLNIPYIISDSTSILNIGPLFNYNIDNASIASNNSFNITSSNIKLLYYSFYIDKGIQALPKGNTESLTFSSIINIGTRSFSNCSIQLLTINLNVENIGDYAFAGFDGYISSISNDVLITYNDGIEDKTESISCLTLQSLKTIGDGAFTSIDTSLHFEFKSLEKIGTFAFTRKNDNKTPHIIVINLNTGFTASETSFGEGNTIYIKKLAYDIVKNQTWFTDASSKNTIKSFS